MARVTCTGTTSRRSSYITTGVLLLTPTDGGTLSPEQRKKFQTYCFRARWGPVPHNIGRCLGD